MALGWLMGLPPSGFWLRQHFALCWRAGHPGQVLHLHRNAWSLAILSLSFPICQSRDSKADSGSILHSLFSTHFFSSSSFSPFLCSLPLKKKKILSLLPYLAQFTKQKASIHPFAMKHLEAQCLTLWRFHEKYEVSLGLQVLMVSLGREGWNMKQLDDINESGNSDRFYFLGSKITLDSDWSHKIKRCLLLGRKATTNLDSVLKSRDITLLTKVCLVRAMVFQ